MVAGLKGAVQGVAGAIELVAGALLGLLYSQPPDAPSMGTFGGWGPPGSEKQQVTLRCGAGGWGCYFS